MNNQPFFRAPLDMTEELAHEQCFRKFKDAPEYLAIHTHGSGTKKHFDGDMYTYCLKPFELSDIELFVIDVFGRAIPAPKTPEVDLTREDFYVWEDQKTMLGDDEWYEPYPVHVTDVSKHSIYELLVKDKYGEYIEAWSENQIFPGADDRLWYNLACKIEDAAKVSSILLDIESCYDDDIISSHSRRFS